MANTEAIHVRVRFTPNDSKTRVSLTTLSRLTKHLGYKSEAELVHYALRKLAAEVLPTYDTDDGPLSKRQLNAIRTSTTTTQDKKVVSSLF